jgi:hypothetical protein
VVRLDRSGEYYGRHTPYGQVPSLFVKFLQENGIVIQYSLPHESQHNDIAKRQNHTLIDMVRSMLSNSTLPLSLWMEALKTATHIINCVPSKSLMNYGLVESLTYIIFMCGDVWQRPK